MSKNQFNSLWIILGRRLSVCEEESEEKKMERFKLGLPFIKSLNLILRVQGRVAEKSS